MLAVEARDSLRDLELRVDMAVDPGTRLALVGPSGAGKSTILRVIAGLHHPEHGRVMLDGQPWLDTERGIDQPPERRGCGFLFQSYALFGHLSVWRNVAYGLRGRPLAERRRRAEAMLRRFGIERLAEADPRRLSGGERQRVALARALAPAPNALLLDEPLSALDPTTRGSAIRELVAMLAEVSVPTVVVTHDFAEAALLGGEMAVLEQGALVQRDSAAEVAARPASAFVAGFAGASVIRGRAVPGDAGLTDVELDGGGRVSSADRASGPVAVSVFPWEISLAAPGQEPHDSALNRLAAKVTAVTEVGNRVRVGLAAPQPLAAEITLTSSRALRLRPGEPVIAAWKATATRLIEV